MFKNIYIKSMEIEGFKGYKEKREFTFSDFTRILAGNGKGKTGIGDAIAWCFLGVDVYGSKKDTLLLNNESKRIKISIVFDTEDGEHTLVKTRANASHILLDGKKITQAELSSLLPEKDLFLSILNPEYFGKMLTDKAKRDLLIDVLPKVELEEIVNELDECTLGYIEKHIDKVNKNPNLYIKERRAYISDEKNELTRNLGRLSELVVDKKEYKEKVFDTTKIEALEQELESIQNSPSNLDELKDLDKRRIDLLKEVDQIKSKEFKKVDILDESKRLAALDKEISLLDVKNLDIRPEEQKILYTLESEYNMYREEYSSLKDNPLVKGDKCPTCKTLVDEKVISNFQEDISNKLNQVANKGKEKAKEIEAFKEQLELARKQFESEKTMKLAELKKDYSDLNKKIQQIIDTNVSNEKKFIKWQEDSINVLKKEYAEVIEKIKIAESKSLKNDFTKRIEEIKESLLKQRKEKAEVDAYNLNIKYQKDNDKAINKKTEEIKTDNDKINERIALYNAQVEACKLFVSAKVQKLSSSIHQHLVDVSIELEKINKSTAELTGCFEVKYKGSDYKTISRSEEMRVGLEISNLIRKATNINIPLFMDNAESITRYNRPENAQIIETKVTDSLELTVEKKTFDTLQEVS